MKDDQAAVPTMGLGHGLRWLKRSEKRWKSVKLAGQVFGGILAGWGGGMGGDLLASTGGPTWKLLILGIGLLLLTAVLVMTFFDRDPKEVEQLVDECEAERAQAAALRAERDQLTADLSARQQAFSAARERIQLKIGLHQVLLQAVETASLREGKTPAKIQLLLDIATGKLLQALGIGPDEDWTISVFQRKLHRKVEAMVRISQRWARQADTLKDKRFWLKGEGYTGYAWQTRKPVVVDDARSPGSKKTYHVPPHKRILRDDKGGLPPDVVRYISVASFPIRIGPVNPRDPNWQPWGAITVTTDRPDLFSHDDQIAAGENRDVVRYLAALIALIVAGNKDFIKQG